MTSFASPGGNVRAGPQTSFAERPASQSWEALPLDAASGGFVWAWFKPPNVSGLLLGIPAEAYRDPRCCGVLTMRRLLYAAGVDHASVSAWQVHGLIYDSMRGASPLLDQPVPPPAAGVDPTIVVYVSEPQAAIAAQFAPPVRVEEMSLGQVLEAIEADWRASLETEVQLKILRKRLADLFARIKSLNRDLNPEERVHASNEDKKDWQDARRGLRDAEARLTMMIKQYDIGDTSTAGQRTVFEQIYEQFIQPRRPFDTIQQAQRDFAIYRKMVATLQTSMNAAYAQSAGEGERRAQQVLKRITDKVRQATIRKNFLGVITD
jgi:hypothetical protein